jgi:hypothetical protein
MHVLFDSFFPMNVSFGLYTYYTPPVARTVWLVHLEGYEGGLWVHNQSVGMIFTSLVLLKNLDTFDEM